MIHNIQGEGGVWNYVMARLKVFKLGFIHWFFISNLVINLLEPLKHSFVILKLSSGRVSCGHLLSQPHFEASVRMRLALPKVGTWSSPRLSKLQNSITGIKTLCLDVFFISLERSSSVDIENGLA